MVCLKVKVAPIIAVVTVFGRTSTLLFVEEGDVVGDVNVEGASDLVAEIEGLHKCALFRDNSEMFWFTLVVRPFNGPNPAI